MRRKRKNIQGKLDIGEGTVLLTMAERMEKTIFREKSPMASQRAKPRMTEELLLQRRILG